MKLKLIALLTLLLQCGCLYAVDPTLRARPRYTLQPGDSMELALRFSPEYDQTVSVQPDGYVSVNLIGEVKVGGLTLDQAHDLIVNDLSARLNHPELNLVLKDFQHAYVVVGGEVASPGKFDYRQNMTAMQAVLLAGGFRGSARDTRIVVFRSTSMPCTRRKTWNATSPWSRAT
jgi:polysaccharide export outer membrane protein